MDESLKLSSKWILWQWWDGPAVWSNQLESIIFRWIYHSELFSRDSSKLVHD